MLISLDPISVSALLQNKSFACLVDSPVTELTETKLYSHPGRNFLAILKTKQQTSYSYLSFTLSQPSLLR